MKFAKFLKDDSGAITVDWVILTAAIVGIAIAVLIAISTGLNSASNTTSSTTSTANTALVGLIGGLGNLSDYTRTGGTSNHDHYEDNDGNGYTVNSGGVMTNNQTGEVVGNVDGDGNITEAS